MAYDLSAFSRLTSAKEMVSSKVLTGDLPTIEEVKTLAKWSPDLLELFNMPKPDMDMPREERIDRSSALARLAYYGAELGWKDEQIATILYDADDRWEKYTARRADTRDNILINLINRARQKHGYTPPEELTFAGLLRKQPESTTVDSPKTKIVYGFRDFLEASFPINWMLEGLLPANGFGLLVAHPGVGKTTLAIQLGAFLALGEEKFLRWPTVGGKKKVLILSFEMGPAPLHLFMTTIARNYNDLDTLQRNLLIAPLGEPVALDTEPGQAFLNNLLDEYMPDLIIIDSLQAVSSKELTDELSAKKLVHYLSSTRKKYNAAMVIVHHNRKKPNEAQKKHTDLNDMYGHTYIAADADFVLGLHEETLDSLMVTQLKTRLGKRTEPFEIWRDENLTFSLDFEGLIENFKKDTERGGMLDV